ncbi:MAG: hypothetical protein QM487_15465 [Candidatus Marithrix sp.]
MMAIIALGFASLSGLNKESFPQLKPSKVQVTVVYPGANPADVANSDSCYGRLFYPLIASINSA